MLYAANWYVAALVWSVRAMPMAVMLPCTTSSFRTFSAATKVPVVLV